MKVTAEKIILICCFWAEKTSKNCQKLEEAALMSYTLNSNTFGTIPQPRSYFFAVTSILGHKFRLPTKHIGEIKFLT